MIEEMIKIHIAKEFSRAPAGRYLDDGPRSGQAFRKDLLVPALKKADKVVIYLDDVEGYGSSFLEEAFGGLVRVEGFTSEELHRSLTLRTIDDAWNQEIWGYIDRSSNGTAASEC